MLCRSWTRHPHAIGALLSLGSVQTAKTAGAEVVSLITLIPAATTTAAAGGRARNRPGAGPPSVGPPRRAVLRSGNRTGYPDPGSVAAMKGSWGGEELEELLIGCSGNDPRAWRRLLEVVRAVALDRAQQVYGLGL